MKHILIAPNAFKNSLDAPMAAKAIKKGLHESALECTTTIFPIGDGGDGTCKLIHEKLNGQLIFKTVSDPLGRPVKAPFSLIKKGRTAVIEMADASGIRLLKPEERDPLRTSSIGTGELIKSALDYGVREIILGMGGSATVDGGCGMLYALGLRFKDKSGADLSPIPEQLIHLNKIETGGLDNRIPHCKVIVLCDVRNKLLGINGAAAVFGPQKGASEKDVVFLDDFLGNLSIKTKEVLRKDISAIVSGGTAGGAAAGMYAFANAELVSGIRYFLELTEFEKEVIRSDYVITGEGSLDEQTLSGKGPFGVAQIAKKHHVPVIGVAGKIQRKPSAKLLSIFDVLLPVNNELSALDEALAATETNLVRTGKMIGNMLKI